MLRVGPTGRGGSEEEGVLLQKVLKHFFPTRLPKTDLIFPVLLLVFIFCISAA